VPATFRNQASLSIFHVAGNIMHVNALEAGDYRCIHGVHTGKHFRACVNWPTVVLAERVLPKKETTGVCKHYWRRK